MIYLAQAEMIGHVKIGFTDDPDALKRVAELQVGSPVPLRLLGTLAGDKETEKDLHRKFAAHRVHGEWFQPTPEILALVANGTPLKCGPTEVITKSVQIKVLTVGRKQFTGSLFNQLTWECIINWHALYESIREFRSVDSLNRVDFWLGEPWGRILQSGPYSYLLWEKAGQLRRTILTVPSHVSYAPFELIDVPKDIETFNLWKFWRKCVSDFSQLDQLYIGV